MFVKINGAIINDAAELQRQVNQFKRDSETPVMGAEADFAQHLKEATQRRLAGHHAVAAASGTTAPESFARKVADAVKVRTARNSMSQKQHAEYAERERNRYKPITRRARTKGE